MLLALLKLRWSDPGEEFEMSSVDWFEDFPGSIVVCDPNGIILKMNEKAAEAYEESGGKKLIGKNLLDCHPEPARSKVKAMLETGSLNIYTIEKNGVRKMIYQAPWHKDNRKGGLVELAFEIPPDMPHFIRK
ncbi:MAG: fold domain protein [Acidobacteria bacterium]|jgi:transcriptional regulator with PAS, ATPase and Fis domain|nr:fold domain protein [Acidobacteriota bacterium]